MQPPKPVPSRQAVEYSLQKPNYVLYTLPELVNYLGYLAELQPFQRQAECEWLQRFHALAPGPGVGLHLAFALLLAPDCSGRELPQAIELFTVGLAKTQDLPTRRLLAYYIALARRWRELERHHQALAQKLARQCRQVKQTRQRFQECTHALKDARAKLDALKAIEQNLHPIDTP
ncbi:hypothetical protein JCM13664_05960 [Methylothermus subterraneus]